MKTREETITWLLDQPWFKELGLSYEDMENMTLDKWLAVALTNPDKLNHWDWEKITREYRAFLEGPSDS